MFHRKLESCDALNQRCLLLLLLLNYENELLQINIFEEHIR